MKISKKDLRRIILEGVVASLEEKKKKKSRKRSEDPPKSIDDNPSDPTTATTDESQKKALEFLSKAIEEHRAGNENARQENLNLMKMIIAPPPNGLPDKYKSVAEHIKKKAKVEMGINIDFDQKVSTTPQAQAQGGARKSKSNSKTAYIQKVIGAPSAKGKPEGDGVWGQNTTDAWEEWVVTDDTIKKIEMLKSKKESPGESTVDENKKFSLSFLFEQEDRPGESETSEDSEIAKFVYKNRGNAADIAKELGYPSTLSGVEKMVRDLEVQPVESDTSDEGEGKESENSSEDVYRMSSKDIEKFKRVNEILSEYTDAADMEEIHKIIYDLYEEGLFNKVRSKRLNEPRDEHTIGPALDAAKLSEKPMLAYFSASLSYAPFERLRFPTARGTLLKKGEAKATSQTSYSVLVDDVEEMLKGGEPKYVRGGRAPSEDQKDAEINEQLRSPGMVAENNNTLGESHGSLIRKRYWGRY